MKQPYTRRKMYTLFLRIHILTSIWLLQVESLHYPLGYIGCFKDDKTTLFTYNRVLPIQLTFPYLNCAAKCKKECKKMGFRFAGTESGEECFCGNRINHNPEKLRNTECDEPCPGQKDEDCGGHWRISIYSTDENVTEVSDPSRQPFIISSADTVSTPDPRTPTTVTYEKLAEVSVQKKPKVISSAVDRVSSTQVSRIQNLTTPEKEIFVKTKILTAKSTVEVTTVADDSKQIIQQPSGNSSSSSNYVAENGQSGTGQKLLPVIYAFIPISLVAMVLALSVVLLQKRRRRSVSLRPDAHYHAACPTEKMYQDDTFETYV